MALEIQFFYGVKAIQRTRKNIFTWVQVRTEQGEDSSRGRFREQNGGQPVREQRRQSELPKQQFWPEQELLLVEPQEFEHLSSLALLQRSRQSDLQPII
jgi:hypothetical protein